MDVARLNARRAGLTRRRGRKRRFRRPSRRAASVVEGGRMTTESPGRHSRAGRIGRGAKPPPRILPSPREAVGRGRGWGVYRQEPLLR